LNIHHLKLPLSVIRFELRNQHNIKKKNEVKKEKNAE